MPLDTTLRHVNNFWNDYPAIAGVATCILLTSCKAIDICRIFENARTIMLHHSPPNGSILINQLHCEIPYGQFGCSPLTNYTTDTSSCLHHHLIAIADGLPRLQYALQLYVVAKLLWFEGEHSRFLTESFWLLALFVGVISDIFNRERTCFHFYNSLVLATSGIVMVVLIFCFCSRDESEYVTSETTIGNRENREAIKGDDGEKSTVTVVVR